MENPEVENNRAFPCKHENLYPTDIVNETNIKVFEKPFLFI